MGRVFVVEDDLDQSDLLIFSLRKSGHVTRVCQTGKEAISELCRFDPQAVIMDVMLPDTTGFDLCRCFKKLTTAPIILFSAVRISEEDRIKGLTGGALDYLTKSYSHRELLARLQNLLAIHATESIVRICVGSKLLKIDLLEQKAMLEEIEVPLTLTEFKLLSLLAKSPDKLVSYQEIARSIWGIPSTNSLVIKSCFSRLKSKLLSLGLCRTSFRTINRQGYVLLSAAQNSARDD
ncbi:MAG TPA: response regulator transcription factor [Oculatellaceae cyanobacterium]